MKTIILEQYHSPHFPTHVSTAIVSIDGERYKYENFSWAGFLGKIAEYSSHKKPGRILDWLKKNTDKNHVTKLGKEKSTMALTTNSAHQRNRQNKRVMMIGKVRAWFAENRKDYAPVDTLNTDTKKYATKAAACPKCGRNSLVQYYLPGKKQIARMCMHRYDPGKDKSCRHCDAIATPLKPWEVKKENTKTAHVPV